MKDKLETVMVLIDQIIIIAFIITLVVIIKNIIQDKATSAESVSETTIQVQQEPVSTSETAESTIETSNPVDETASETVEQVDETSENKSDENSAESGVIEDVGNSINIVDETEKTGLPDSVKTELPELTDKDMEEFMQMVEDAGSPTIH